MTQEQFARQFQIALGTLRDWEQGVRRPDSTAKAYLRVIDAIPEIVQQALSRELQGHTTTGNEGNQFSQGLRRPVPVSENVTLEALPFSLTILKREEMRTATSELESEMEIFQNVA
jgi:hypothetical protein